jgi:hypothetical protein
LRLGAAASASQNRHSSQGAAPTDATSEIGTTAAWETSCAAGDATNVTTRRAL